MNKETTRLLLLGKAVVNEQFPSWLEYKPTYVEGIAYTLMLELTASDTATMSDEHIKELMKIDLEVLKKSLEK